MIRLLLIQTLENHKKESKHVGVRVITRSETISKPLIYCEGNQTFTDLDAPGIVLTQLKKNNFSHIETLGERTDVEIRQNRNVQRRQFNKTSFDKFMNIFRDESVSLSNGLDEHVLLGGAV